AATFSPNPNLVFEDVAFPPVVPRAALPSVPPWSWRAGDLVFLRRVVGFHGGFFCDGSGVKSPFGGLLNVQKQVF
ncbi:hypothetical protein A2U01_0063455, partial [Trifolium medium]|nr:hypothetical protein [Trifolium medium]